MTVQSEATVMKEAAELLPWPAVGKRVDPDPSEERAQRPACEGTVANVPMRLVLMESHRTKAL